MKKLLLVVLTVSFGTVLPAVAQMGCVNFDNFCDALELEMNGTSIVGTWVSYDCAGSNGEIDGFINDGNASTFCVGNCPSGNDYVFTVARSTFDLLQRVEMGDFDLIQDNSPWTLTDGACPTEPIEGEVSTIQ